MVCHIVIRFKFLGFSKNSQIQNFMKIRPGGRELFHADRQTRGHTDMMGFIVALRSFATVPKK